jgi:hypothetical protein
MSPIAVVGKKKILSIAAGPFIYKHRNLFI